jgi:DNA-binding NarL/FixJ family response regulator
MRLIRQGVASRSRSVPNGASARSNHIMKKIRVLLVDDLNLVRHGIRALLSGVEDLELVGEGATADDAVGLSRRLCPDVILMDQDLPGNSFLAARTIRDTSPQIEIIFMTKRLDGIKALQAVEAGATGYVLKDIPLNNLAAAIRSVCNSRAFFHPEMTRQLVGRLAELTRELREQMHTDSNGLTTRELDVLIEMAKGGTDREIASKFVVSEGTIKTHIHHILSKLKARNRTEAVAYVLRRGMIE